MASTRIKICGITRVEDVWAAVESGADALGLNFFSESARCVSPDLARELVAAVPPFISVVGLFVDEPADSVKRTLESVPLDLLQFHGDETPDYCEQFSRPWIKALRVKPGVDITAECERYAASRGILLDTWHEGSAGGTGETFDWNLAADELPLPVVLAGGLHEGNVGEAVRALRPAAVDVASGVESAPGIKDAARMAQFVRAVRDVDEALRESGNDQ